MELSLSTLVLNDYQDLHVSTGFYKECTTVDY